MVQHKKKYQKRFGLSRVKIGRLLKRARDQGIVEIKVKYHPVFGAKLEEQLKERFGLKRALIALDQPTEDEQRALLAGVVSTYLSATLKDGMIVSIGQGRNVSSVSEHIASLTRKNVHSCLVLEVFIPVVACSMRTISRAVLPKLSVESVKPCTLRLMFVTPIYVEPCLKMKPFSKQWTLQKKRMWH